MSGSSFGKLFCISTWGESHGLGIGVSIDGCPAGIPLSLEDIQADLDRRKPGQSQFTTKRKESDQIEILSGTFEGLTTGTPIALVMFNRDQRSKDYASLAEIYRPGHADFGYDMKYGFRDYRGGGRSSGRETAARVAAGAVAKMILRQLGVSVRSYTLSIGNIQVDPKNFDWNEIMQNPLYMPDRAAYEQAAQYVNTCLDENDSAGGVVECVVKGLPPGIGQPVFDKLDALVGQAIFSIGAVKSLEFGLGFQATRMRGSTHNDPFYFDGRIKKRTNHSGGVLGGMTDGDDLVFRAGFKPTSSIGKMQQTVNKKGENVPLSIEGRHDPLIVPRAVVVVEAMTSIVLADLMLQNAVSKIDNLKKIYGNS